MQVFLSKSFPNGVGQLVAVCGLFLWGGQSIAEMGCAAGVSRLWRRWAEM